MTIHSMQRNVCKLHTSTEGTQHIAPLPCTEESPVMCSATQQLHTTTRYTAEQVVQTLQHAELSKQQTLHQHIICCLLGQHKAATCLMQPTNCCSRQHNHCMMQLLTKECAACCNAACTDQKSQRLHYPDCRAGRRHVMLSACRKDLCQLGMPVSASRCQQTLPQGT